MACASPVILKMSPLSVLIVGVADWVVDTNRFVTLLFVSVDVDDIVGTVTPSTATTPADTREIVVSEECPSSMFPVVVIVARVGLSPLYTMSQSVTAVLNCAFVPVIPTIEDWSPVLLHKIFNAVTLPLKVVSPVVGFISS